jgi:hypothetical protein
MPPTRTIPCKIRADEDYIAGQIITAHVERYNAAHTNIKLEAIRYYRCDDCDEDFAFGHVFSGEWGVLCEACAIARGEDCPLTRDECQESKACILQDACSRFAAWQKEEDNA